MEPRVPVRFEPAAVTAWVCPGTTVAEAARAAGVLIAAPCGSRAVCGACGVRVAEGELDEADVSELAGLRRAPAGVRLACRARVTGPVTVRPIVSHAPLEPGASPGIDVPLVAGVDLGTTSVAALLVEARGGREIARSSIPNAQLAFGADVLSRISASLAGEGVALRDAAAASIGDALRAAARAGGVALTGVERVVIAGNTAMSALLANADVEPLSHHPFDAPYPYREPPVGTASLVGLRDDCHVELVPPLAAFVGGDALAATLAAGLVDADAPELLVDLGTNAEVVLAARGKLVAASTAAGPAFEGVGVSCGGPAVPGAVVSVEVRGEQVLLETIGGKPPRWFSGAGLVSALATLRETGHLAADGALLEAGPLLGRFSRDSAGVLGVDMGPRDGGSGERLTVSQLDVRTVQLAKAAIRVAVDEVLATAGVSTGELSSVAVAGAFGGVLRATDLVALGVLPSHMSDRVRVVGNAALEGAAALALDPPLVELLEPLRVGVQHVDLAADAGFGAAFVVATQLAEF